MADAIMEFRSVELRKMPVSERSSFPFSSFRLAVSPAVYPYPLSLLSRSLFYFPVREGFLDFLRLIQCPSPPGSREGAE
jgi:hypothetical protein